VRAKFSPGHGNIFVKGEVGYIREFPARDLPVVLTGLPPSSTKIEVRECRDVWAVLEQPGLQSLFTNRESAIDHAKQILRGPGLIEIRDEDSMLLTILDLRDVAPDELACA
jgi:hypothetical protein